MATLTPTLKLVSSDVSSEALSLSVTDSLTVGAPSVGPSRITAAISGGTKAAIDVAGGGNRYIYLKHTGFQANGSTATTNVLEVHIHDGSADRDTMRLKAGEFAYFPVLSASSVKVVSGSSHTILTEYAYYTVA